MAEEEYTPTTERVRYGYSHDRSTVDPKVLAAEFDRWLEGIREQNFRTGQQVGLMQREMEGDE